MGGGLWLHTVQRMNFLIFLSFSVFCFLSFSLSWASEGSRRRAYGGRRDLDPCRGGRVELSWGSKPTEAGVRCPAPRHQSTVNKIFQSTGAEYFPESLPPSIGARTSPIGIGHWPHGALLSLEITAGTDRVNCLRNIGAKTGILKFTFLRQQDRQLLARMRTVLMCLS